MNTHEDLGHPVALTDLIEKLRRSAQDPASADNVRLRLEVHGGMTTERYDLDVEVASAGVATMAFSDELSDRKLERADHDLQTVDVGRVLRVVDLPGLLAAAQAKPQLLPDSLVGRLTVEVDGVELQALFLADDEQARTAGQVTPPAVARVVETLYEVAERASGIEGIRPY